MTGIHEFICFFFSLISVLDIACAKRILVVPYTNVSHTIVIEAVMRRLAERGHELFVLWANEYRMDLITRNPHYQLIEFSLNVSRSEFDSVRDLVQREFINDARRAAGTETRFLAGMLTAFKQMNAVFVRAFREIDSANKYCRNVLSDELLMRRLREHTFDLAIVDDFFVAHCTYLIPHALSMYLLLLILYS